MAAPTKKRAFELKNVKENEDSNDDDSDSSEGTDSQQSLTGQEEIQVDFEGRNPIDSDFHGIKQLLHQLFLKAHLNLSELTDIIIGQNYVGSVIKQAFDGDVDDESDDDDDDNDANDVFGITTVVNLTEKQNVECVSQLRKLLLELCREHGREETVAFVQNILDNDAKPVGLLINERFVNIPSQITIPLLQSLSAEIKKAKNKKMPFEFSYFILICKLYKLDTRVKKKKNKNATEVIWSNQEEEFIENEAEVSFEFSVKNDSDSGLSGRWSESDAEMTPFRKVLIFNADKLDAIIEKLDAIVNKKVQT